MHDTKNGSDVRIYYDLRNYWMKIRKSQGQGKNLFEKYIASSCMVVVYFNAVEEWIHTYIYISFVVKPIKTIASILVLSPSPPGADEPNEILQITSFVIS